MAHVSYLYAGLYGHSSMVPRMWSALAMGLCAAILRLAPAWRAQPVVLVPACVLVFAATWIDKGLGMMAGGYTPK